MATIYKCKHCKKEAYVGLPCLWVSDGAEDILIEKYGSKELKDLMVLQNKRYSKKRAGKIIELIFELRKERKKEMENEIAKREKACWRPLGEYYKKLPRLCPSCKKDNWAVDIGVAD